MHGFSNFFTKSQSRESTPPPEKEDGADRCMSPANPAESYSADQAQAKSRAISIAPRGSNVQRSLRGIPGSPFEVASSPRDRYPNFVSYFREVIENRVASSQQHCATYQPDYRRQRSDGERYQPGANAHQAPRHDYRQFVSPLYGDVMDDIQEHGYNKCERYGEISNTRLSHVSKGRFDNRYFSQKLTENLKADNHQNRDRRDSFNHAKEDTNLHSERRGSGSCGTRHKHKSIQDLFRSIGKKVGSWRHETHETRRESCAMPIAVAESQNKSNKDEFRSRSKSLDAEHLHTASQRPWLEDCSIAYQIFDEILREGANLRRASQEAEKRRSSLGHVHMMPFRHRASDASIDPHHAAILFRDARGLPVVDPFMERVSANTLKQDESQIFVKFFKFHKCYDLMPTSAKLLVLDTRLKVKAAFYALVTQGVRAAPLWDENGHTFVGMLTITDFIMILQKYYQSPEVTMEQLEEHRLETWRGVLKDSMGPLIWLDPDASIYDAIRKLIKNRIHRLPIIDLHTGNPLCIITHKRILRFLFLYINDLPKPSYLNSKLRDLKIGTLHNIETAYETTTIKEALTKFVNRRVSALPIVDSEGRLKNIYAKFDVINLAASKTYNNLDITLKEATEHRNEWFEGVRKCTLDETLYEVMDRIVKAEVHRLVVVNDEDKVVGIISLSDLLAYIVLRPTGECGNLYAEFLHQCSIDEIEESEIANISGSKRCSDDRTPSSDVSGIEKDIEPQPSTSKAPQEFDDNSSDSQSSQSVQGKLKYSNFEEVD